MKEPPQLWFVEYPASGIPFSKYAPIAGCLFSNSRKLLTDFIIDNWGLSRGHMKHGTIFPCIDIHESQLEFCKRFGIRQLTPQALALKTQIRLKLFGGQSNLLF